ncbi:MAG: hypothetical protein AAF565_17820 [Pseudomonadota bacterium]
MAHRCIMQVAEHSADRLVLWDRPWFMAGMVWLSVPTLLAGALLNPHDDGWGVRLFVALLGIGLGWIGWAKLPFQRFVFDRGAGRVFRTRWQLWRRHEDSMALDRIVGVRQERDWAVGSNAPTHRLLFDWQDAKGRIKSEPMSAVQTSGRQDAALTALEDWLTEPGASDDENR